jgi:histidyl-tRNA synthetase
VKAPRGTYDVLPDDHAARGPVLRVAETFLERAGYRRVETPAFEHTELFARGVGTSTDIVQKEMYTFDDAGGRSLTLRPEGTASVCRAYLDHGMQKLPQPAKLWYHGPFFRHERAQAGRYRQFWQIGAEAIGSDAPAVDAEVIVLLASILDELEVGGLRLRIGSLGSPATRAAYREELQAHLRAHEAALSDEVRARIDLNPLRAFDSDHPGTREVMATAPRLLERLSAEDAEHFAEVRALLDAVELPYEIDPTLVRGLDYYARTVFEFTSDALGAQSGVGGGGRYDGLMEQLGGPPTPACGFAAGVERMLLAAGDRVVDAPLVDLYVALDGGEAARVRAFRIAAEARRTGLATQLELAGRSMKGQLKQASRLHARYVAIVDDTGQVRLKDMDAAEQQEIADTDVVAQVLRGRGLR